MSEFRCLEPDWNQRRPSVHDVRLMCSRIAIRRLEMESDAWIDSSDGCGSPTAMVEHTSRHSLSDQTRCSIGSHLGAGGIEGNIHGRPMSVKHYNFGELS